MEYFAIYKNFYHQDPNQKIYAYEISIENYRFLYEERILSIGFDAEKKYIIR